MNTLIVHTGGIGDFILTCPAIQELAKNSSITVAGNTDRVSLAVQAGIAERVCSLDSIDFHTLFADPSEKLIASLKPFQQIIVWMNDADKTIEDTLNQISTASIRVFPGLPPKHWNTHASRYFQQCLQLTTIQPVHIPAQKTPNKYDIIIHPGSGDTRKNWPLEKFHSLAKRLQDKGSAITWCLGPAELERNTNLSEKQVLQCNSLSELTRHLASANLYIGNDGGISHLAASTGVHTIPIFISTNPKVWVPLGSHVHPMGKKPAPTVSDLLHHIESSIPHANARQTQ